MYTIDELHGWSIYVLDGISCNTHIYKTPLMLPRSEALTGARPEYDLIRVEPKKAKRRERINSARELALCFVSLDRMLLSERS